MAKTKDKTVYKTTGWNGFGQGANTGCVDVKDGKIARIRPIHVDEKYTLEEINPWTIHARGSSFYCGVESLLPPMSIGYKQRVYSKNRVPYPLKRVDWDPNGERHPENRGKSKFVRISWDEAAQLVADEVTRIHETYGPTGILCQADGHGEGKNVGGCHGVQTRLLDLMGGYTLQSRQPDSWEGWYWGAKHMWGMDPLGKQAKVGNMVKDIAENTDCVFHWGCDAETTTWGFGGQFMSRLMYWWTEIGIKQVFVCPDVNYACAIHADKWIPVLPNTDAALQLAIAYTWIVEDTYDKEYIATHTYEFDQFKDYVLGKEDGVPKTPKWAEKKCGVPSRQIKALARYWATHNCCTAHGDGGGYIRSCFSHEPARLEIALLAMQALGHPGRGMFSTMEWGLYGNPDFIPVPLPAWGVNLYGAYTGHVAGTGLDYFVPQTLIPDAITLPEGEKISWYGHCVAGLPLEDQFNQYEYPAEGASRIHMIWSDQPCWETCWNGGHRMQDALRHPSIETYVVQSIWMEDDVMFADIVLPISTKYEQTDMIPCTMGGYNDLVVYEAQAIEPVGEARSDTEAVLAVAEKLGMKDKLLEAWCYPQIDGRKSKFVPPDFYDKLKGGEHVFGEPSLETLMKVGWIMGGASERMEFDEFKEKGYLPIPTMENWEERPVGMRDFYEDASSAPMKTPTGLIEFYSLNIASVWPDDDQRPPVPHWIEESPQHHERLTNERGKDYPFLIVSNHPRWRVHAEHDDMGWLHEIDTCKVTGPDGYKYEPVWINPIDARERGIKNGDIVRIYNERGSVLGGAFVTERICRHAISQDHGARVDSIVHGEGKGLDRGGANNLIAPAATTSQNAPGEVTNSYLVNIEKVDVFELARKYPEEFNRPYDEVNGLIADAWIINEGEDE